MGWPQNDKYETLHQLQLHNNYLYKLTIVCVTASDIRFSLQLFTHTTGSHDRWEHFNTALLHAQDKRANWRH